jgi:hypothetical protein
LEYFDRTSRHFSGSLLAELRSGIPPMFRDQYLQNMLFIVIDSLTLFYNTRRKADEQIFCFGHATTNLKMDVCPVEIFFENK